MAVKQMQFIPKKQRDHVKRLGQQRWKKLSESERAVIVERLIEARRRKGAEAAA